MQKVFNAPLIIILSQCSRNTYTCHVHFISYLFCAHSNVIMYNSNFLLSQRSVINPHLLTTETMHNPFLTYIWLKNIWLACIIFISFIKIITFANSFLRTTDYNGLNVNQIGIAGNFFSFKLFFFCIEFPGTWSSRRHILIWYS